MKTNHILLIYFIFAFLTINAQKSHTTTKTIETSIEGNVKCEGENVPFVNVTLDGTTIGTMTDESGHFQLINLPVGNYTVRVTGLGYKPSSKKITATSSQAIHLNFNIKKDVLRMEEVVVSADRNQTNRREVPVVITSISPKVFELTQSVNLAEGLCFTPGLRTETNCQNCGFSQLRMNGMEGAYTQILMNSRPVFSGLAGVYGLELIPTNMIERLEVIRGGGSSLFGGNAIAGTVNIITKETYRNTFEVDNRIGLMGVGEEKISLDEHFSINGSVVSKDKKTGGYIYAMFRDRGAYDANNDGYTELVKMKNTTFGFNVYHKLSARSKLSLDGYRISEFRRGGNKLDYLAHEADIAEQLHHLITGFNVSYDLFTGEYDKLSAYFAGQNVERGSYYGVEKAPDAYGSTDNFSSSAGVNYLLNSKLIFPSSTLFGIENTNDYMKDTKLGANGNKNTTLTHQFVNTTGAFLQQDWKTDKVNVSLGARYDYYLVRDLNDSKTANKDLTNGVFLPRVSLLYKLTPDIRFRAGYAKGYRAPQVFNEDLHIQLVNATRVQTINSDDLEQEISHSFTASFNTDFTIGEMPCNILVEGFYTRLSNPFADQFYELDTSSHQFAYLRVNANEGAYVTGANFEYKMFITSKLETQLGFTLQKSAFEKEQAWGEGKNSVSKDFMRTPNQYGYATFNWNPIHHFNTNLSLNYTGSMWVPHFGLPQDEYDIALANGTIQNGDIIVREELKQSKAFLTVDLQVSYEIDLNKNHQAELEIYAGVKNIFNQYQNDFDKGVFRDAGYVYGPRQPRIINFGLKINKF